MCYFYWMLFTFMFHTEDWNFHRGGREDVFSYLDEKPSQLNCCEVTVWCRKIMRWPKCTCWISKIHIVHSTIKTSNGRQCFITHPSFFSPPLTLCTFIHVGTLSFMDWKVGWWLCRFLWPKHVLRGFMSGKVLKTQENWGRIRVLPLR